MRKSALKRIVTTATVVAGSLAGRMAAGAVAQDLCPIDPTTRECEGEYFPDGYFFPDSAFMPGVDHFPDGYFAKNPNSDDTAFRGNERMPSCSEEGEFITGFGTFVTDPDRMMPGGGPAPDVHAFAAKDLVFLC